MAKTKEDFKYLAMNKDGCLAVGTTLEDACTELTYNVGGVLVDYSFYRVEKINVKLTEVL